jgi:hypothetical protein
MLHGAQRRDLPPFPPFLVVEGAPMLAASILDAELNLLAVIGGLVLVLAILRVGRAVDSRRAALPIPKYALDQYAKTDTPTTPSRPGKERRRFPRHRSALVPVEIHLASEKESLPGWVADYSQGGVRLMAERSIGVGQFIKVRARANQEGDWVSVEVRHCHAGPGKWTLGCMFLEKVSWEQVKQFCE